MIGRHCRTNAFIIGALLRTKATLKEEKEIVEKSHEILEKVGLAQYVNEFAKNLP